MVYLTISAIILAAGKGIRLRPLTWGIPKQLLPIKGRPVIDWCLQNVTTFNEIKEIFIAIPGTTSDEFEDRVLANAHGICLDAYFRNYSSKFKIKTIPTFQRETGGDVRHVLEETGIKSGTVLVAYGDILTSCDLNSLLGYHKKCKEKLNTSATVLLFEVPESEAFRFGIAKTRKQDGFTLITDFIEKPKLGEAPSKFANAGYYLLEVDEVFDLLPKEKIKIENSLFPQLAKKNKLAGFLTKLPYWIDIGTMEAYQLANRLAHENLILPPPILESRNENLS